MLKIFLYNIIFLWVFSATPGIVFASIGLQDIVYVDCANGINQASCGGIDSPCLSLDYAAPKIDGGLDADYPDIMYIRGTCQVLGSSSYNAPTIYPNGSFAKFVTWPGEAQAFIDGGASPTGTILGDTSYIHHNLTLENLQINGEVVFRGTNNLLIKDCDFWGGGTKDPALGGWNDVLFTEHLRNGHIVNNKFHDANGSSSAGVLWTHYGFGDNTSDPTDTAENLIVEYNTFYRALTSKKSHGLFLKHNPETNYIRNNFFYNLMAGVRTSNQPASNPGHNVFVNNNIFKSCGDTSVEEGAVNMIIMVDSLNIYNNTFINNTRADISSSAGGVKAGIWNNLHIASDTTPFIARQYNSFMSNTYYLDYDSYFNSSGTPRWSTTIPPGYPSTFVATSLAGGSPAGWQYYLSILGIADVDEINSIYGTQNLSNVSSGTVDGFRLTNATPVAIRSGGRGGGYYEYMGAWSPTEMMWIGYCEAGLGNCNIYGNADLDVADIIAPGAPSNISVN